jgi:hypothetical protein
VSLLKHFSNKCASPLIRFTYYIKEEYPLKRFYFTLFSSGLHAINVFIGLCCSNPHVLDQPDESKTNQSFHQWLASVTERINETMHFQFPGKPDPLVFHVPQVGFNHCSNPYSICPSCNLNSSAPFLTTPFK